MATPGARGPIGSTFSAVSRESWMATFDLMGVGAHAGPAGGRARKLRSEAMLPSPLEL